MMNCNDINTLIALNILPLLAAFFLSLDAKKKLIECAFLPLAATTIMALLSAFLSPEIFVRLPLALQNHARLFAIVVPLAYLILAALGLQHVLKLKKFKGLVITRAFTMAMVCGAVLQMILFTLLNCPR